MSLPFLGELHSLYIILVRTFAQYSIDGPIWRGKQAPRQQAKSRDSSRRKLYNVCNNGE
jgi:hypothetical protein